MRSSIKSDGVLNVPIRELDGILSETQNKTSKIMCSMVDLQEIGIKSTYSNM